MGISYYYFDDDPTEARHQFSSPQDWTATGIKAIELYFYGDRNNDVTTQMYLAVGDGDANAVIPYHGDANDIKKQYWQPWRIDLQDIVDANLAEIEHISIGFRSAAPEPRRRIGSPPARRSPAA